MKPRLWEYLKAAFNARPWGMVIPPNWVGLTALGLCGLLNPGVWVIGAGLEVGYLYSLVTHAGFRRWVDARYGAAERGQQENQIAVQLRLLDAASLGEYRDMERRCQGILNQQARGNAPATLDAQGESLGRLLWIFLRLILTRQNIERLLGEDGGDEELRIAARIKELEERLKAQDLNEDLRKSLTSQLEIVQLRLAKRKEAREKLAFVGAELERLKEQVELLREQSVVSGSQESVSQRIDQIAATLSGTTEWISEQQRVFGQVEDLVGPPPVTLRPTVSEGQ